MILSPSWVVTEGMKMNRRAFFKILGFTAVMFSTWAVLSFSADAELKKPDKLIVRAWPDVWQESLHMGVSEPFTKKYGISIEYDNRDENILFEEINKALAKKQRPPIDVNWDTSANAMRSAIAGFAEPLTPVLVPNLKQLLPIAKPTLVEGWPLVNLYTYTYVLAYRTDMVKETPGSWKVFLDPKWKKAIGMYDDGIGFTPVAAKLSGGMLPDNMESVWDFYRKIKPNIGLLADDAELTEALVEGTTPLQCCIISNVLQAQRRGAPVAWVVPKEGVVLERDAMWVPRNLPPETTYWGMKYVNFALSKEAQEPWCGRLGTPPVNKHAKFPEHMKYDLAFFTSGDKFKSMIVTPAEIMVEYRHKWFKKFREIMR
jgi:putative spermidine/putrescine transport system substrate-binding protein